MTKSHEVVAGAVILGVVAFIVWTLTRGAGGSVTPLAVDPGVKSTQAGLDAAQGGVTLSGPVTGSGQQVQAPPNGDSWVQGVDASGKQLGAVEVDSQGNFLVSASKGPGTETRSGVGHF